MRKNGMKRIVSVCALFVAVFGMQESSAATLFNEDFSGGALPAQLEQASAGTPATFAGGVATFPGSAEVGRSYVRTVDDDYYSADFVAEITTTIPANSSGDTIAFFGIGAGDRQPGFPYEPRVLPYAYMFASPTPGINDMVIQENGAGSQQYPNVAGPGTHRLRLSYDATTHIIEFAIHQNYAGGAFVPTQTALADLSDNGYNLTNSRVFFGSSSGTTFDNFTIVPEPASLVLLTLACCFLFRARPPAPNQALIGNTLFGSARLRETIRSPATGTTTSRWSW